ncbi:hypothetical protein ACFQHV_13585 [Promicromonospora thailandica]|uniref:Uncharacterized protein n=1 Tax=Promicromonospora thailandica TaxID=765201 RepID=A0A9X2G798_9MICO|nr:hypothetical protein [Promicromonospora thailandica]MCP2266878.1 hypothetical protein [Promicromonospora thailandica]BFF16543.1 hypothetical protein GCM10025730_00640 [Promicromonospora thailandica]
MPETAAGHGTLDDTRAVGRVQYGALVATVVIVGVVGVWSYAWPQPYFDHFPVFLGEWVSRDGPYNEHLVRDHGAMYLALGAASLYGLARPSQVGCRLLGIAWTVFGVLHFAYHVTHPHHLPTDEAVGQVVVLAVAVLLALALMVPGSPRGRPSAPGTR